MSSGGTKPPGPDGTDPFADHPLVELTEEQHAAVQQWLEETAPRVGLHGWRLHLSRHEGEPESTASTQVRVDSDEAYVALEREHAKVPEPRRRATLVHELLHCHLQHMLQPLHDALEAAVPTAGWTPMAELIRSDEERIIERLAWAISERLPPAPDL